MPSRERCSKAKGDYKSDPKLPFGLKQFIVSHFVSLRQWNRGLLDLRRGGLQPQIYSSKNWNRTHHYRKAHY